MYKHCDHLIGTKASQKLTKTIVDKRFCNAVKQLSPIHQTSNLEAFHSIILRFAPKLIAFSYNRTLTRQKVVAIHYKMKPTADSKVKLKLAKDIVNILSEVQTGWINCSESNGKSYSWSVLY
uniref:Uncharacterized protein n=1 Tax=Amphimedon queenslandica TaxID=400682 RepID=A0A1X7V3W8_AMPQE